jgi:hypothetical protein
VKQSNFLKYIVDMKVELTLDEAFACASNGLRQKMEYSIRLLQKAERLALAYDSRGGITSLSAVGKTRRPCCTLLSWRVYDTRGT